jgi:signal recognition particle subunit SRP19
MGKRVTIWPANIDAKKSRRDGRMVSKRSSVRAPKLEEMEEAADELGLHPEMQPEKAFPKSWWERSGRVVVDKTSTKGEVVRGISKRINELRKSLG